MQILPPSPQSLASKAYSHGSLLALCGPQKSVRCIDLAVKFKDCKKRQSTQAQHSDLRTVPHDYEGRLSAEANASPFLVRFALLSA